MTDSKDFKSLSKEDHEAIFAKAAKKAIEGHHAAGRATCHLDEKGMYLLHPDGRKEYLPEVKP